MAERRRRQAGFTLIEIMVVMVIIGLLMALVGPNLIGRSEKAKTQAAAMQIERLGTVLDTFRLDVGRYPTTQEGLQALVQRPIGLERWDGPYLNKGVPKDPVGPALHVPQSRATAGGPTTSTRSAPTARPADGQQPRHHQLGRRQRVKPVRAAAASRSSRWRWSS